MTGSDDVLMVVALRTDQPNAKRQLKTILAAMEPVGLEPQEAQVTVKPVSELVAADLDRLARIFGWSQVRRLNVGDVVTPADDQEGGSHAD